MKFPVKYNFAILKTENAIEGNLTVGIGHFYNRQCARLFFLRITIKTRVKKNTLLQYIISLPRISRGINNPEKWPR